MSQHSILHHYPRAIAKWLVASFLMCAFPSLAQDTESILVRNAILLDPTGQADDREVNMLVREGILEVITEDKISRDEADLVVNAGEGYILGKLVVGESPNFMILDQDPRENFEALLDTRANTTFAMHTGRIVSNRLEEVQTGEDEDEPTQGSWLAYTPPPMAVPMNYQDASQWNRFETRWLSGIVTGAIALDRMKWLTQDAVNEGQFGSLNAFDGGEVRALRFGIFGTINFEKPWVFTLAGATR